MAVPGIISPEGTCVTGGALRFADGLPLSRELSERCGLPVAVMNDAKCAALAEARWGALSDCRDGVVIVLGTGVGGALIKDGQVHMGSHYAAGEFSFVNLSGEPDQFPDMWGPFSGNKRLLHMAALAHGVPEEEVTGEKLFAWLEEGDPLLSQALDRFTDPVARMIFNLQVIYDPERFAIGGGISRQPRLLESIRGHLAYICRMTFGGMPEPQVTTCKFFNEANLLGAYANYLDHTRE